MFTGLIEQTSPVLSINKTSALTEMEIKNTLFDDLNIGDSVAVNGACLTITKLQERSFCVEIVNETSSVTSLYDVQKGDILNLERAMRLDQRLGGHIVSGHVDGMGLIENIYNDGDALVLSVKCSRALMKYMILKGSVTIDGISLTLFDIKPEENTFILNIIPETQAKTTISKKSAGDIVNIEADMMIKHIDHLLNFEKAGGRHV
ncbi:riboflavin synthase subunit alpha [Jeotgalicoccus coquinae]|uniref:Riboflavin synthase n=1 Tax=Jeotgalicoccus coquinae TaxID=709509 RepID=A0A6V7R2K1_9STAP|nr:riboflavin synthase [Jeotgalicoccus coquinae]MBB6423565.1 riboflavin synthase [Jeotgalicoccus coquinae]GGE20876.1 riboflavin synthase subunit alpha [Jeotgalicoccus coquinae]CAD2071445.1 Riboflavin synthase [Jeotgalicoccus coquinae]